MKRMRIFLPLAVFMFTVMASEQITKSSADESESLAEQPQQSPAPRPARSRSEEMLDRWNDIGNKLDRHGPGFSRRQVRFQAAEGRAHLCAESSPRRRTGFRPDTQDFRIKHRARLRRGRQSYARRFQDQGRRGEVRAGGRRGRSASDSTAGRRGAGQNLEILRGTGWPTTPPSGRSPSSTAPSTTASLWSTIARTTWCRRTRGAIRRNRRSSLLLHVWLI